MSASNANGNRRYRFYDHGTGNRAQAIQRIRRAQRRREDEMRARGLLPAPSLATVGDSERLLAVLRELRETGGQGAGLDGVTYAEIGRADAGALCRQVAELVRQGEYRPSQAREVAIRKADGGTRVLRLRSILDRAVAKCVVLLVEPLADRHFLPNSYGFRPGRNVYQMLAAIVADIVRGGRRVLMVDDVRRAFDNVVIDRVMPLVGRYVTDPGLLALIEVILRGGDRPDEHPVGIDQGCALSPNILNLQLHYALDLVLRAQPELPVVRRYADNLCAACTTEADAERVLDRIREALRPEGHTLKGTGGGIFRLEDGQEAELLGFLIHYADGQVQLRYSPNALETLRERLERVWLTPSPIRTAKAVLTGWVRSLGPVPTGEQEERTLEDICLTANPLGLQEAVDVPALRHGWQAARQQWSRELSKAMTEYPGEASC